MEARPTVFIVDDDPDVIIALANMVELIDLRAESYESAKAFLEAYQPDGPACLVLDMRLPGMGGLELQSQLKAMGATLPIIMITGHGDVRLAVDAMKAGAVDFLEKPFRMQELCEAIQAVIRLEQDRWQRTTRREQTHRQIECLTPAERAVMDLVAVGKTNKGIAQQLGLSVRAVEDRRRRMMKKLKLESREELHELLTAAETA